MTVERNRLKDVNWSPGEDGRAPSWERVLVALLMDIRDELKALNQKQSTMNSILTCPNFLAVPTLLKSIRRNTAKSKETQ